VRNRVEAMSSVEPEVTRYPLGTLIQIDDDRNGFPGGTYMLADAGDDRAAVLINLEFGCSRNGPMPKDASGFGVTPKALRENIARFTAFRVIKRVIITSED
jgi:hypothetical protein